jgi:hypothetical protein
MSNINIDEAYEKEFLKPIISWGTKTCLTAVIMSFLPALYILIVYGVVPSISEIVKAFILVAPYAVVLQIVEPPSYFPILGIPGTYMSFLAGNISNVRVPCSAISQSAAGVTEGSKEGSIVSTIAIGVSVLVNLVILIIGVFFGAKLLQSFPPFISRALNYVLPSVFGGVFGSFAMRDIKLAIIALATCVILVATGFINVNLIAPIGVIVTIFFGIKLTQKKNSLESK